jgi:SAM-dependent methyltransferase
MRGEIKWRYPADNAALHTTAGERIGGLIRVRAKSGAALFGPYLDVPAGQCRVRVLLAKPGSGVVDIQLTATDGQVTLASQKVNFLWQRSTVIELAADLAEAITGLEVRIFCRGEASLDIEGVEIDLDRELPDEPLQPDRPVGFETSKTYADKIASGFFQRYLSGPAVMEIGYKGYDGGTVPIVPQAIGVDVGYPGYDGETFPFASQSFDAIYSSHCYEHIGPWKAVLRDWYRLLRIGGFLVIVVPHQLLFERKRHLPSYFNPDHKRYYTAKSLLAEIEEALEENGYRIRHLIENDKNFDYAPSPKEGSSGCYEIELVIEKVALPYWHPDDGSVRAYPAGEFRTPLPPTGPWSLELDLSQRDRCLIYGPYIALADAKYVAEFHFEPVAVASEDAVPNMSFDVARDGERLVSYKASAKDMAAILRAGKIALDFANDKPGALFEFRIFAGMPSDLKIQFKGVDVRYARLPRG